MSDCPDYTHAVVLTSASNPIVDCPDWQEQVTAPGGGPVSSAGAGTWLSHVIYGPSLGASYSLTTSAQALDTTNLAITFTAPASGKVTLQAAFFLSVGAHNVATNVEVAQMGFYPSAGFVSPVLPTQWFGYSYNTQSTYSTLVDGNYLYIGTKTGLTSGHSYTYYFGGGIVYSTGQATLYAGGGNSAIELWVVQA